VKAIPSVWENLTEQQQANTQLDQATTSVRTKTDYYRTVHGIKSGQAFAESVRAVGGSGILQSELIISHYHGFRVHPNPGCN